MALPGNRTIDDYIRDTGERLVEIAKKVELYSGDFASVGAAARTALKTRLVSLLTDRKAEIDSVIAEINSL